MSVAVVIDTLRGFKWNKIKNINVIYVIVCWKLYNTKSKYGLGL